jgi:hypothetical protein
MLHKDYRKNLRTTIGSSAAPYGYTLATWTSGAVFIHARGVPNPLEALALMVGAVVGFALVGVLAFGGMTKHFDREPSEGNLIWGSFHFFSVGVAIGAATLIEPTMLRVLLLGPWEAFYSLPLIFSLREPNPPSRTSGIIEEKNRR